VSNINVTLEELFLGDTCSTDYSHYIDAAIDAEDHACNAEPAEWDAYLEAVNNQTITQRLKTKSPTQIRNGVILTAVYKDWVTVEEEEWVNTHEDNENI